MHNAYHATSVDKDQKMSTNTHSAYRLVVCVLFQKHFGTKVLLIGTKVLWFGHLIFIFALSKISVS